MVTLDGYVRDLPPPNEGGRSIKDHKNYPLGVTVETQLIDSLHRRARHSILQFYQTIKQSTSFQANYTRATLICIDLSLSILPTKVADL